MVETAYTSVASGDLQSGVISNLRASLVGLLVSVPTSCAVFLKASSDITSANFRRITSDTGSGDFTWSVGSGNKAIAIGDVGVMFPFLKLETSVAMTAVCSITIITKL